MVELEVVDDVVVAIVDVVDVLAIVVVVVEVVVVAPKQLLSIKQRLPLLSPQY